jgi:hypothetical protein
MIPNLDAIRRDWYNENAPTGKALGYPECCIKEFCDQPPALLKVAKLTDADIERYNAGCIGGRFTGFIPCSYHAKQILAGQITIGWLIQNRDPRFPPFPDWL